VTVVAVLSPGFDLFGEDPPDIVDPWGVDPDPGLSEEERWLKGFGKRKPGIKLGQAQAFMNAVSLHLAHAAPKSNKGFVITICLISIIILDLLAMARKMKIDNVTCL